MKHWENMGGEPISGTMEREEANRELWRRVAKLTGKEQAAFLRTYGDRAKAAIVAADGTCRSWNCHECPLGWSSKWIEDFELCSVVTAMAVYARMIEKLGKKPEEK